MENIFGKYRTVMYSMAESLDPAYRARLNTGATWDFMVKAYNTHKVQVQEEQERLQREMETFLHLDHPHILPIIDYGIERDVPYFVTAYMESGSLRKRLDQAPSSQLTGGDVIKIISQVGQALHYAHEHHVQHGNIKPENIFFNNDNEVVLTDFCLPHFDSDISENGPAIHSIYYPEQERLSEKSDQYALGYLAYELFTGQRPAGYSLAALSAQLSLAGTSTILPPSTPRAWLKRIEVVLRKAMAVEPDERYEDMAALLKAIDEATEVPRSFMSVAGVLPLKTLSINRLSYLEKMEEKRPVLRLISQVRKSSRRQRFWSVTVSLFVAGAICVLLLLFFPAQPSVQAITPTSRNLESTVIAITPTETVIAINNSIPASAPVLVSNIVSPSPSPTASISNSQSASSTTKKSATHSSSKSSHRSSSSSKKRSSHQSGSSPAGSSQQGGQSSGVGRSSSQNGTHGFP
jgi:serine/threonine protein kinase